MLAVVPTYNNKHQRKDLWLIKALWYMSLKVKLKVGESYQYIT